MVGTSNDLRAWLERIEALHPANIELGLERVGAVFQRLFPVGHAFRALIVGGTNGKGSCCAFIEALLSQAGHQVGKYTSPHLVHFNERVVINGEFATDQQLCDAFVKVEAARQDVELTYFEFTTLAAFVVFEEAGVDFAVCEVGLGGRLDAVNLLSPDVSVITSIGLDHTAWLGDTLDQIALEKAPIARPGKPIICGELTPPKTMLDFWHQLTAEPLLVGKDFLIDIDQSAGKEGEWQLSAESSGFQLAGLPALPISHQYRNAASAILAVHAVGITLDPESCRTAIRNAQLPGRCQVVEEQPLVIADVAHNLDSTQSLAEFIGRHAHQRRCHAVFSMLADKDINACLKIMQPLIDEWHIAELAVDRALPLSKLRAACEQFSDADTINEYESIQQAYQTVKKSANSADCIVVFGSFHVVGDIIHDQIESVM